MSEVTQPSDDAAARRLYRRNYLAHAFDGGLFIGAMAFVNASTVLPTMVKNLGGPNWLIALVPILMLIGFLTPPIFTAHLIDRQPRYMPILLFSGVFQRAPYLVAALVLLYLAGTWPVVGLMALALTPLVAGTAGGSTMTAWQQLIVRTIPENRRSSVFAWRYAMSCVLGVAAGWVVKEVLDRYPGCVGYGLLHLAAFTGVALSYVAFTMIREPHVDPPADRPHRNLWENLRDIPNLLRSERRLVLYLAAGAFASGIYIVVPFLAIRATHILSRPESYVGDLVTAQMAGAILGNILAGYLGDRFGGKVVMMISQGVFIAMAAWSVVAATDAEFRGIFVLFGFAFFALQVGASTLNLEICPLRQRSTYLAIITLFNMPAMLAATAISALVGDAGIRYGLLVVLMVASLLVSLTLLTRLRDPRAGPA